jgi:hypothetical protein
MLTRKASLICFVLMPAQAAIFPMLGQEPAAESPADQKLMVFRLRHTQIDRNLENLIKPMLSAYGMVAVDRSRNYIVVSCAERHIPTIEKFVVEIDEERTVIPSEKPDVESRGKQIRVVWLMSGLKSGRPPPQDLTGVIEELSKIGVGPLDLVAQTIVRAVGDFQVRAYPDLDDDPTSLEMSGELTDSESKTTSELSLDLSATFRGEDGETRTTTVSTTVVAPHSHPVVLCVNPVRKRTSVFVIQVFPVE